MSTFEKEQANHLAYLADLRAKERDKAEQRAAEAELRAESLVRELADCRRMGAEVARQLETANALLKQWGGK